MHHPLQASVIAAVAAVLLYILTFGSAAHAAPNSQLNWGRLTAWEANPPEPPPPDLAHALHVAEQSLRMAVEPVRTLHLAGTLNKDPAHQESDRAKANFPQIFDLAVCTRAAAEPLRAKCAAKASSALLGWANTYQPTGNPVDESFMVPLIEASDLVLPVLSPSDREVLLDWIGAFAAAGDAFYAAQVPPGDDTSRINNLRVNNWMAWRLCIRGMASVIRQDKGAQEETRRMLSEFIRVDFLPGGNGETYDFEQRDSLHYHIFDLQALVSMVLFTPTLVDQQNRDSIDRGLNFIKPFYLGGQQHVEFQHTVNTFDVKRIQEDTNNAVMQTKPWDPREARVLFRLARTAFPDIRPWTQNVVDAHYDPSVRLLAAIFGEPEQSAGEGPAQQL